MNSLNKNYLKKEKYPNNDRDKYIIFDKAATRINNSIVLSDIIFDLNSMVIAKKTATYVIYKTSLRSLNK